MKLKKPFLSIREIIRADIPHILEYWRNTSDEDIDRLGEQNRPDEENNKKFLEWFCDTDHSLEDAGEDIVIWEVDGHAIGYSTLKQFKIPEYAQMHMHMWDKSMRGKGYGAVLFCLTATHFRHKYGIHDLYAAPKWDNKMPNRMLTKIGFPICDSADCLDREYPNGILVKHNKYLLKTDIITAYLEYVSEKFEFHIPNIGSYV